jgi:cellulose synthase/poly-beta-1,6-N-acetylglucosamine synthase-like glycosyltransferase
MELETDAQIIFEKRGGFRRGFERIRFGPVFPGDSVYPGGAGNFGAGANMAFRTRVLEALGGFDEALDTGADVPGGGDLDIFYRIIRAGYPLVYEPRFMAFHEHRRDMDELSRQYRRSWGLGFMCYLTKCLWTDPERRVNVTRLIVWWFSQHTRDLLGHLKKRLRRQEHVPPSLLIGELWGGVVGLLGGYARSRRRVDEIRRQVP